MEGPQAGREKARLWYGRPRLARRPGPHPPENPAGGHGGIPGKDRPRGQPAPVGRDRRKRRCAIDQRRKRRGRRQGPSAAVGGIPRTSRGGAKARKKGETMATATGPVVMTIEEWRARPSDVSAKTSAGGNSSVRSAAMFNPSRTFTGSRAGSEPLERLQECIGRYTGVGEMKPRGEGPCNLCGLWPVSPLARPRRCGRGGTPRLCVCGGRSGGGLRLCVSNFRRTRTKKGRRPGDTGFSVRASDGLLAAGRRPTNRSNRMDSTAGKRRRQGKRAGSRGHEPPDKRAARGSRRCETASGRASARQSPHLSVFPQRDAGRRQRPPRPLPLLVQNGGNFVRPFATAALPERSTFAAAEADLERFARQKGLVQVAEERPAASAAARLTTPASSQRRARRATGSRPTCAASATGRRRLTTETRRARRKSITPRRKGAKERRANGMWKVRVDWEGFWIEDAEGRALLDTRASQVHYLSGPACRKIEAVPEMERALANILVLCQREILHEDRDAIEEECRAALGKAWGVSADKVWTPDLAEFQPEEDHHGDTEGTEKTTQAKRKAAKGKDNGTNRSHVDFRARDAQLEPGPNAANAGECHEAQRQPLRIRRGIPRCPYGRTEVGPRGSSAGRAVRRIQLPRWLSGPRFARSSHSAPLPETSSVSRSPTPSPQSPPEARS